MNYKQFNVVLPIRDNNVSVVSGLMRYDTANIVNVKLMDGLEAFDFTGYTEIYLNILKPDGKRVVSVVTDNENYIGDNNPYSINVVDPSEGRISFTLLDQATICSGTHFAQISIASGGKLLTSARLNYHVEDILMDAGADIGASGDYTNLIALINRNSAIASAERTREDSEAQRIGAEYAREEKMRELEDYITGYLDNAVGYVDETEGYMNQAQYYAMLAQNPSQQAIAEIITQLDLPSRSYVDNLVDNSTKDFDAGFFTDTDKKLLKVRTGTEAERPVLDEGELGFATDSKRLYVGSVPINGVYIASNTEPAEKHIFWIDTSASGRNVMKFWNGSSWQAVNTLAFS